VDPSNHRIFVSTTFLAKIGQSASVTPEVLEARGRQFGVAHGVLDVSMAEIHLQGARVGALVGKLKAAGVSEHVWVGLEAKLGHDAQPRHHLAPPRRRETQHRGRCRHPALAFFALSAVPRVFYGTA